MSTCRPEHLATALAAVLTAGLCACSTVGPDYVQPDLCIPQQWSAAQGPSHPAQGLAQNRWWQAFGDPVLDRLIDEADRSSLDLAQAQARVRQARAAWLTAGAARLPNINASASVSRSDGSNNMAAAAFTSNKGPSSAYLAGFDASWELDVFGGLHRAEESARASLDANIASLDGTRLSLRSELARNYIELRASQAQLDIVRASTESQRQTVDVTRERYRLGLTSYLDVSQADAQRAATEANIPALSAAIAQSIHRLGILVGREPAALKVELSAPTPLPADTGLGAIGLPAELLARRPDLRAAERNLAAASADIGVATANLYPKFDLTLGLGLQSNQTSRFAEQSSRYWSIVPGLALPVFNGGRTQAQIASRQALFDEALARYRSAYHSALEDVENALTNYYAEKSRQVTLTEAVSANQQAVTLAKDRYRRGLTTFLDVLTTENGLFNAQRNLSQSQANLLTDLVALHKALGGGWQSETSMLTDGAAPGSLASGLQVSPAR